MKSSEYILLFNQTTQFFPQLSKVYEKEYHPEILIVKERLNDIKDVNEMIVGLNNKLKKDDFIILKAETQDSRTDRIFLKFSMPFAYIYYPIDFILKRVFPKWLPTRYITQYLTKGKNRVMSKAEIFGRIHACGFFITDYYLDGFNTQIQAKKVEEVMEVPINTCGVFIFLKRVGYQEKRIRVLKLRTMHCYSEFIQDVVYDQNSISSGGKIKNDFRITKWGSFFRRYWIDELPMIYNFIKGDMKFVGVRPLSEHYFGLYPADMQKLRTRCKPGLVPPFYADMPKTLEEVIESERKYLEAYFISPFCTDFKYFFLAMNNIFFKQARSS